MNLPDNTLLQGGKYRIIRFISSGGFGCTYEAELVLLHKRVAIKEFFVKDFCNRDENNSHVTVATQSKVKLIETEVYRRGECLVFHAASQHRTCDGRVRRKRYGLLCNGLHRRAVLAGNSERKGIDYIDGESLQDIVKEKGKLDESLAVNYIKQVADALKYVHSLNRLHLDIKPGNIMTLVPVNNTMK